MAPHQAVDQAGQPSGPDPGTETSAPALEHRPKTDKEPEVASSSQPNGSIQKKDDTPQDDGTPRDGGGEKGKSKEPAPAEKDDQPAPWKPGVAEQPEGNVPHHGTDEVKEKITHKKEKIKSKTNPPGGFDETPLPDFPPGYTLKFTFHKASNLPAADIHNVSADPYLHATLTAEIPRRHKEDPVLTHRTKTIRATLEPEWEDEWIVSNVPKSGFRLKCRLYDEDYPDHDDRLGNFTHVETMIDEHWKGINRQTFEVKKRAGSKRAYLTKAICTVFQEHGNMTPLLEISVEVLGRSEGPGAQMCTLGPGRFIKHFSPMMGRLTGIKVNKNEEHDEESHEHGEQQEDDRKTKKYDFQANEVQLQGPVPPKLYHRYVEFRPLIGLMFSDSGLRGRIMNKALHKQHRRIYNFDRGTEWGSFKACTEEASLTLLRLAHFDEGGRIFTYVLTLDGLFRFTETGKEFGIDLLSKHTMHSDVATYIACSGEFFIRRLEKPTAEEDPEPSQPTHPTEDIPGGPPEGKPPKDPSYYQLIIDNDSGTYRPDKSILPDLKEFMEQQFPGLGVVVMHCADDELTKLKEQQAKAKKKEGRTVNMVLNRSPSASSFSSSDESRLGDLEANADGPAKKSKKERAWDLVEDPHRWKDMKDEIIGGHGKKEGESSRQAK